MFLPKGMQHTALVGKTIWLGAGITRGVAARTEPSDGEYEKHLWPEPQEWTGGGNFTRRARRELNRKRGGGLGSRDTRDGTPSSVVEEYLLGGKSPRTGQVAEASAPINWGLMDKETRIPECIRDNKHRSACKNANEVQNR